MNANDEPKPAGVPVFSCIVHVSRSAEGGVQARVANLPDIEATAATERQALAKVVGQFKERVGELLRLGQPIPWIDPPLPLGPDQQQRLIAVHL